jgi:hypothetical protein
MPALIRYCWYYGDCTGEIEARYYERGDTCGKPACEVARRENDREEREEAHRDLDERMGW